MDTQIIERLDVIIGLLRKLAERGTGDTPEDAKLVKLGPFLGDSGEIYRISPGDQPEVA